jgi:hypothetical protein
MLFFKWTKAEKPIIIISHSDDFRGFGSKENLDVSDNIIKIFNKYQVTDATDKEFVGIRIPRDKIFNYYLDDQYRMIDTTNIMEQRTSTFHTPTLFNNLNHCQSLTVPRPMKRRSHHLDTHIVLSSASSCMVW